VSGKAIVCRCEDVTVDDVRHAVARGHDDVEEVKRYTGFGTGPCQGKECLAAVAGLIAELGGKAAARIEPFTARPPLEPTRLAVLAAAHPEGDTIPNLRENAGTRE
jgi:sarcosine oxidase subunit beta